MNTDRPEMCVVVLSYRNEHTVTAALESLITQDEALEIVLSHSGGGDTPALVAERFPGVSVLASESRRTPGAARNAGIAATHAPFVAFHSGDSVALPGWAKGRMRLHRRGAPAVASAMAPPRGPAPLAAHLLLHSTRMPHVVPPQDLRFGVSYSRDVLLEHGPFPEDRDGEEDVELNARLIRAGVPLAWAPGVMTATEYAGTPVELLSDQYRRGDLRYRCRGDRRPRGILAGRALLDAPAGLWRAARPDSPVARRDLVRSAPLVLAGSVAAAGGILSARRG
jgi:glycosyltransferase involved in cell wall biosynthesis